LRADRASFQDLLQAVSKLEGNQLDFEFTGFNLREIQDVVDDGKQRLGGRAGQAEVFALIGSELHVENKVRHAENAVEWRANFVAHRREKSALGFVCGLSGALRVVEQLHVQLSLRDILGGDDDSADAPLRIPPGINGGAYPLLSTIGDTERRALLGRTGVPVQCDC
jgi:hypothetical protein